MRHERPVPAQITLALDLRGLSGDQVDRDLGVWESPGGEWTPGTAVDRWEDGTLVPTRAQVERLALLTAMPVERFYRSVEHLPDRVIACDRSKRARGLTIITASVDADGVLHRPFTVPGQATGHPARCSTRRRRVHLVRRDPETGLCDCGLPDHNRWHDVPLPLIVDEPVYDPQRLAAGERPDPD